MEEQILQELERIRENNYLVIVEGKKDRKALENFGLKNIIYLKNKPLFEIIESVNSKEVIILTDLDLEGRKLFSKLRFNLQKRGVKLDNKLRNLLFKSKLRQIEGLITYFNHQLYTLDYLLN